ncbi:hypothetical protein B0T20DRAFT_59420 [Sordaria brevicollis]|uniref:Integral membrane protein n=1 Tax=Sordaria brevicollis TaxID=83679 RepID=A0AAE0P350_SORBR|nr:hypothetical protein B0T20DRAFT_59420 [Sordaria brevicollis]
MSQPQNGGNGGGDGQGQGEYFTEEDVRRTSTTSTTRGRLPSLIELAESPLNPSRPVAEVPPPAAAAAAAEADIPPPTALGPITEQPPAIHPPQQTPQEPQVQPRRPSQQPDLVPHRQAPPPPPQTEARRIPFQPSRQESAIRLRRLRAPSESSRLGPPTVSGQRRPSHPQLGTPTQNAPAPLATTGRRRSSSEPQRPVSTHNWADDHPPNNMRKSTPLVPDHVGGEVPQPPPAHLSPINEDILDQPSIQVEPQHPGLRHQGTFRNLLPRRRRPENQLSPEEAQALAGQDTYDSRIVDFLDVIDPEVAALSSITNVQNSLFVPSLGRFVNRRPTYDLSQIPVIPPNLPGAYPPSQEDLRSIRTNRTATTATTTGEGEVEDERPDLRPSPPHVHSFSTVLTAPQYAILPKDATLEGWREEDIRMLNDYVRHMLHSKRSKFKQRMKAFGKYVRRPLGFLVTLYATLITLFGLAWVLFLIGWIYVGDKQLYAINVIDNVLVALFAIVGDGLAPFRAVDTYHMIFVARYHLKTIKLRNRLLVPLKDPNDVPLQNQAALDQADIERAPVDPHMTEVRHDDEFIPVLSEKSQARFVHHQKKLAKSHTFYKPHETGTHHAFPIGLLIAIVCLLDLHSCLQITLGTYTWSTDYRTRSSAVTTAVLCCSIAANCTAGLLITIGDRRTRKKDVLERLLKQELTAEVMHKMEKEREKKARQEAGETSTSGIMQPALQLTNKLRKSEDHGARKSMDHGTSKASSSESSRTERKESAGRFNPTVTAPPIRDQEKQGTQNDNE